MSNPLRAAMIPARTMPSRPPLRVYLTVDTELWPSVPGWPARRLPAGYGGFSDVLAADIHGLTSQGGYGLPYQIGVLNHYGLRASYFVETLFSACAGAAPLAHIVQLVRDGGHEVQLHLHPEWLGELAGSGEAAAALTPHQPCQYLWQLPQQQQSDLIRDGIASLQAAGAPRPLAFRAGSYGGDRSLLRALAHNGIPFDSSYDPTYLSGNWGQHIAQPQRLDGVWEFPVAAFTDLPGHQRHAQLCACSFAEMRHALQSAWRAGWHDFVIVLHSFELITKRGGGRLAVPDRLAIARYTQLCAFLAAHRDRYRTTVFSELDTLGMPPPTPALPPLRSRPHLTLHRMAQQAWNSIG